MHACSIAGLLALALTSFEARSAPPPAPALEVLFYGSRDGTGDEVYAETPGTTYRKFGIPSINDAGQVCFTATLLPPAGAYSYVIMAGDPAQVVVRNGDPGPGVIGATFISYKDPLIAPNGTVTFIGKLHGPVNPTNKFGIWTNAFGPGFELIARKGSEPFGVPGGQFKTFISVASTNDAVAYVAKMVIGTTGTGPGNVTSVDDVGLWIRNASGTVLALREGQTLLGKTVKSFRAMTNRAGTPGQGHGVESAGAPKVAALVLFTDRTQAWYYPDNLGGTGTVVAVTSDTAPGYTSATFAGFGIPAQSLVTSGINIGRVVGGNATGANKLGIFFQNSTFSLQLAVAAGIPAPGVTDATFAAFGNPVLNSGDRYAFTGKLRGTGISGINSEGIWWDGDTGLTKLAQGGDEPPGVPGGQWRKFISLALPENGSPVFTARMTTGPDGTAGRGGVTEDSDIGLWLTSSTGAVQLGLREGQTIDVNGTPKTIETFATLVSVAGSPAQIRSHNANREVVARVIFTDGSQAIVKVTAP